MYFGQPARAGQGLQGAAPSSHHPVPQDERATHVAEKVQSTLLSTAEAPSMKITHLLQHAYVFVSLVMCLHVFCWCCMWCGCGRGCNVVGAVCCKRAGNVPYVRCETMVMLLCCRSLSWMCHYRSISVMRRISRLSRQRSSCETHVIHMSYTCHTRVIHIPYTRHMSHVIHMCRTCG